MFVKREPKAAPAPKAASPARGTGFFGTQAGKMGASPSAFSLKGASNVKLSQGKQTLGRDGDDADIVLRGAAVSSVHAAITVKGSTCSVQVSQCARFAVRRFDSAEDFDRSEGVGYSCGALQMERKRWPERRIDAMKSCAHRTKPFSRREISGRL
jgi:hypothetical protein